MTPARYPAHRPRQGLAAPPTTRPELPLPSRPRKGASGAHPACSSGFRRAAPFRDTDSAEARPREVFRGTWLVQAVFPTGESSPEGSGRSMAGLPWIVLEPFRRIVPARPSDQRLADTASLGTAHATGVLLSCESPRGVTLAQWRLLVVRSGSLGALGEAGRRDRYRRDAGVVCRAARTASASSLTAAWMAGSGTWPYPTRSVGGPLPGPTVATSLVRVRGGDSHDTAGSSSRRQRLPLQRERRSRRGWLLLVRCDSERRCGLRVLRHRVQRTIDRAAVAVAGARRFASARCRSAGAPSIGQPDHRLERLIGARPVSPQQVRAARAKGVAKGQSGDDHVVELSDKRE
jgi:hypothetical protein